MKLNPKTLNVLKNFATINPGIVIKPGNVIQTIAPMTRSIWAKATVPDEFTDTFGIGDLSRFIRSVTSLMENPELDFGEYAIKIHSGPQSIQYHYTNPTLIAAPPEKNIRFKSVAAEVVLTNKDLQSIMKSLGILGLPEIAVVGDGRNITLTAYDGSTKEKKKTHDQYSINIGETDLKFNAVFEPANLKIIDGDYNVSISKEGIAQFVGVDISYWIVMKQSSKF